MLNLLLKLTFLKVVPFLGKGINLKRTMANIKIPRKTGSLWAVNIFNFLKPPKYALSNHKIRKIYAIPVIRVARSLR